MATNKSFTVQSFLTRFLFALALVFASYNPSGYSYFHWASNVLFTAEASITPMFALAGVALLIGWTIFINATFNALGGFGLGLAAAFFAIIVWWLVDIGLIGIDGFSVMAYITLTLLAAVLAIGMSWSHIRRRMTGQIDVDDVED